MRSETANSKGGNSDTTQLCLKHLFLHSHQPKPYLSFKTQQKCQLFREGFPDLQMKCVCPRVLYHTGLMCPVISPLHCANLARLGAAQGRASFCSSSHYKSSLTTCWVKGDCCRGRVHCGPGLACSAKRTREGGRKHQLKGDSEELLLAPQKPECTWGPNRKGAVFPGS